jgi:hypothetical protein
MVDDSTVFPATNRSVALVVVTEPLLLVVLFPDAVTATRVNGINAAVLQNSNVHKRRSRAERHRHRVRAGCSRHDILSVVDSFAAWQNCPGQVCAAACCKAIPRVHKEIINATTVRLIASQVSAENNLVTATTKRVCSPPGSVLVRPWA